MRFIFITLKKYYKYSTIKPTIIQGLAKSSWLRRNVKLGNNYDERTAFQ